MGILEQGHNPMEPWTKVLVDLVDLALWVFLLRCTCLPSLPTCRSGLPDRGNHIRTRAGALVRLVAGVGLDQRLSVNRHGVWRAFLGASHTSSFTRLIRWLVSTYPLRRYTARPYGVMDSRPSSGWRQTPLIHLWILYFFLLFTLKKEKKKEKKKKKKKASFLYRSLSLPTFVLLVLLVLRIYQPNHCHTPFILCTYVDLCSTLNTRDMVFPFTTVGD